MKSTNIIPKVLFIVILVAIVIYRYIVLEKFGFKYTDSDQSIMWLGLTDYSNGVFHEPRYYGQAYNSMLEALLAIPLFISGMPVYKALPVITSLLTLLPFLIISGLVFVKKNPYVGVLILTIPLLLPVEYSFITSLSRGFVTGIFLASIAAICLFYQTRKWLFLFGLLSVLAYSLNANSVVISMATLAFLFFENIKSKSFYIYTGVGVILGLSIHLLINRFYSINPNYKLHDYDLRFKKELFIHAFEDLDLFFNSITPLFWNQGFVIILIFLILAIYFIAKKSYSKGFFFLSFPVIVIISLGLEKIHQGCDSVFFSYSRMYLGLPIIIAVGMSFVKKINPKLFYLFLIIPVGLFVYKLTVLDQEINRHTDNRQHVVAISETQIVLNNCKDLLSLSEKHNVDLIVVINDANYDFSNYGCPACTENFPKTLRPSYERRTWRLIEDEQKVYSSILIMDDQKDYSEGFDNIIKVEQFRYLIENNSVKTIDLLKSLDIEVREF